MEFGDTKTAKTMKLYREQKSKIFFLQIPSFDPNEQESQPPFCTKSFMTMTRRKHSCNTIGQ